MEDDGLWLLLALGPTGAAALYWMLYRYYRNTDKSHAFERETRISAQPITGNDLKTGNITGTRNSHISGDNLSVHRQRARQVRVTRDE
ncbi:hypothetical protein [Sinimarinibacterium sp. NLF-5-8]|uniref:hypothetical protein n=1 Tax=Sinimarinibacterium sp. NLF-5-8 TaxID=2698684 RepID=UPI00137BF1AC|nr:hypothetical protein [Sinimarinibacterium sp. NLF-5-8]QHS11336.1 hypothetical protein GT972_15060 [Sinimarinibacterium sp. NLF-5-8]